MSSPTVIHAILEVMRIAGRPLSSGEVLALIRERNLYAFRAKEPLSIVRTAMRRHSIECPVATAARTACLTRTAQDTYSLLPSPIERANAPTST
jgi:hypothetical protein